MNDPKIVAGLNPFLTNPFPEDGVDLYVDGTNWCSPVPAPPVAGEHHEPIAAYGVEMGMQDGDEGTA